MRAFKSTLFLIMLLISVFGSILSINAQSLYPAKPTGQVNDLAGILSSGERQQLERDLRNYRDTTSNVFVLLTLPSLDGRDIAEVAAEVGESWKTWEGERYNGLIMLVAPNERQIRIQVGYGLEGAIPDIIAGRVIDQIVKPAFRENKYYAGISRAFGALMLAANGEFDAVAKKRSSNKDLPFDFGSIFVLLFAAIFILTRIFGRKGGGNGGGGRRTRTIGHDGVMTALLLDSMLNSGRRGGGFGGGGGGGGGGFGGFSGGGGFGFGGGGASGSW